MATSAARACAVPCARSMCVVTMAGRSGPSSGGGFACESGVCASVLPIGGEAVKVSRESATARAIVTSPYVSVPRRSSSVGRSSAFASCQLRLCTKRTMRSILG